MPIIRLPYSDADTVIEKLSRLKGFVWLRTHISQFGIVDIAAVEPEWISEIPLNRTASESSSDLRNIISKVQHQDTSPVHSHELSDIFNGGLIGYCSYETGRDLILTSPDKRPGSGEQLLPKFYAGYFTNYVVIDHQGQRLIGDLSNDILKAFEAHSEDEPCSHDEALSISETSHPDFTFSDFQGTWNHQDYAEAFQKLITYIYSGDTYQVNLTQRFHANYSGDLWKAFKQVHKQTDAPHSAYISMPSGNVLSFSPESFLSIYQGVLSTKPIKGTRPRASDPVRDEEISRELLNSPKDRAENVMIVDLLRNDLGKVAKTGSVTVDKLCELETFSNVHHLVSTISAELKPEIHPLEALFDCSPGGSITGAPKKRAMEIIEELEPFPRSVYCGSVFFLSRNGRLESNIAIRTMVCREGDAYLWGGGGIVADSVCESEYEESRVKIRHIAKALGVELHPKGFDDQ
ncbi:aminodeoxychorismate synthase, component I [Hahella sp. CCB-MM4]|uniref:aminodeoxychorismate synthase component I n=1 Tax=Hahella sp. (strain CCB-MM4) TaxID=1926491 RepID=UPI000B9C13FD|nr:aminodeoxychorismate synthase component I [Hahella sp. CCB-MM4]OZG73489.1 aminodeoxychorismate synthase, component I [Hahella sp. CCB-MM4]